MEATNAENQSLTTNSSHNFSQAINSTSREYVFAPVSYRIKLILFTVMLSFGVYGLIANSLILYFKHKQHRKRRHAAQRAFSRSLTEYFINSLALSDLLCSAISFPLFATELFIDFTRTDAICRFKRFVVAYFPLITILNLLVIGIERYLGIFHPFFFISRKKAKRTVVGAWVLGLLLNFVLVSVFRLVRYDNIGDNYYTLICKYDSSFPEGRVIFVSGTLITYIIPSFILTFINLRILRRQRNSRQHVASSQTSTKMSLSQLKVTRMFVFLIFAFIIPYIAAFTYLGVRTATKLNVSFTVDYITRYISVSMGYANGSISATILIYYDKLHLRFLSSCFRSRPTKIIRTADKVGKLRQVSPVNGKYSPRKSRFSGSFHSSCNTINERRSRSFSI